MSKASTGSREETARPRRTASDADACLLEIGTILTRPAVGGDRLQQRLVGVGAEEDAGEQRAHQSGNPLQRKGVDVVRAVRGQQGLRDLVDGAELPIAGFAVPFRGECPMNQGKPP
jgi:hypothetical protein